jgi:hypothetical protein
MELQVSCVSWEQLLLREWSLTFAPVLSRKELLLPQGRGQSHQSGATVSEAGKRKEA